MIRKHHKVIEYGRKLDLTDLKKDPIVVFQWKLDPYFTMFMCFIFPSAVSYIGWNEDPMIGFFVAGCLRYCLVLHKVWLVNSAAHLYGSHPYDDSINPSENQIVAFLSAGEGWHNWHHKFPYDYAASEFGIFQQYNPTKLFIDICAFLGLATNRKRALNAWQSLKERKAEKEKI